MGINPKSSAADLGDVLGSFLAPAVKAKPLLAGATNALGYGALSKAAEGADLEDIVKGAPKDIGMGLALSALPAGIARQANKKTDLLLKGATRSPKEALRLQKRVGEKGGKLCELPRRVLQGYPSVRSPHCRRIGAQLFRVACPHARCEHVKARLERDGGNPVARHVQNGRERYSAE